MGLTYGIWDDSPSLAGARSEGRLLLRRRWHALARVRTWSLRGREDVESTARGGREQRGEGGFCRELCECVEGGGTAVVQQGVTEMQWDCRSVRVWREQRGEGVFAGRYVGGEREGEGSLLLCNWEVLGCGWTV